MDIDRRDFIKYGVLGMGAAALLGTGVDASAGATAREKIMTAPVHEDFMKPSGNEASIAGYPLSWWFNRFQLPLHIYFAPVIEQNVRAFRQVFQDLYPKGHIRFAAEACAHPAVFRIVIREGAGLDVASCNETQCALESGARPEQLDLNGYCKEDVLIARAVETDMLIVADSIEEFQVISRIAGEMGRRPRVVMRLSGFEIGHVTAEVIFTAGRWTKYRARPRLVGDSAVTLARVSRARRIGATTISSPWRWRSPASERPWSTYRSIGGRSSTIPTGRTRSPSRPSWAEICASRATCLRNTRSPCRESRSGATLCSSTTPDRTAPSSSPPMPTHFPVRPGFSWTVAEG